MTRSATVGQMPNANPATSGMTVLAAIVADLHADGHYLNEDQAHRRLLADRLAAEEAERTAQ